MHIQSASSFLPFAVLFSHLDIVSTGQGFREVWYDENAVEKTFPKVIYKYDKRNSIKVSTDLSGLGDALHVLRSHPVTEGLRTKRSFSSAETPWRNNIPYVFDESYGDDFYRNMIRRAFIFFTDHTCLLIDDVTDKWDRSDPSWFYNNGYPDNSYIEIFSTSGCLTEGSGPANNSKVRVAPCHDTDIAIHEIAHGLGMWHVQQTFTARNFINVFPDSISPDKLSTFYHNNPNVRSLVDDLLSTLMYRPSVFGDLDGTTYVLLRPDQRESDQTASNELALLKQINKKYKCADNFCSDVDIDCNLGFLTVVKGDCRCICPEEFDPNTNCREMIREADPTRTWTIPLTLFGAGNTCPKGFEPGFIKMCGTSPVYYHWAGPNKIPTTGNNYSIPLCSKTTPTTDIDWNSLPIGGRYCFVKPAGIDCGGVLTDASMTLGSVCTPEINGSVGDITVNENSIDIKLCCTSKDNWDKEAHFQNDAPFQVLNMVGCPYGVGMRTYINWIALYAPSSSVQGTPVHPFTEIHGNKYIQINFCYIDPPKLGCNEYKKLSWDDRTFSITTPGYPKSGPTNTRCIYCFNSIPGSQILLTINDYKKAVNDKFRCKRFNKWGQYNIVKFNNLPYELVSESNYLCCDYWISHEKSSADRGVSFSVTMLPPEETCYDASIKGMNYLGTTNITELSQPCLNWEDTQGCFETPYNAQYAVTGFFKKNFCRNPNNVYHQPMCYTYRNGSNCIAQYCDPCNIKAVADYLPTDTCTSAIDADSTFCTTNEGRFGCLKSCDFLQAPTGNPKLTCASPPPVPDDAIFMSAKQQTYKIGDRAYVKCADDKYLDTNGKMMLCTRDGWNAPNYTCTDCPGNWTIHNDRCIFFQKSPDTRDNAINFCQSLSRNGSLMEILDQEDQDLVRRMRIRAGSLTTHTWINAVPCDGSWCYLNTDELLVYKNWEDPEPNASDYPRTAVYMYKENPDDDRNGKWVAGDINKEHEKYTYFCQMDRIKSPVLKDLYSSCQNILKTNPVFCTSDLTRNEAALYCPLSCGFDQNSPMCEIKVTKRSHYIRTDGIGSVLPGATVTFKCKDGYIKFSGDTITACGLGGKLLGKRPSCIDSGTSKEIGAYLVRERSSTLSANTALNFDVDGLRIPVKGKISRWTYFCANAGNVVFLVLRKDTGNNFTLVGKNDHTCVPGFKWTYQVPEDEQISVQFYDTVGVWSSVSNTITVNNCNDMTKKALLLKNAIIEDLNDLQSSTEFTESCMVPSISYTVQN